MKEGQTMYHAPRKGLLAALALIGSLVAAAPSGALTIVLPSACDVAQSSGQVFPAGQAPGPAQQVYESQVGEGVVMWDFRTTDGRDASVIRICQSGRELRVIYNTTNAYDRLTDMAFGPQGYTLPQIANEMNTLGSDTHRTRNTYGSCVCDALGY
ncbi:hypothetical protein [Jannaschia sp. CCS1]|uniref:hypothetical protein n=1 Tax=Jannaschia sp. (strain CCS1) TaxID=290400 RepID=UPI001A93A346|nr:hypothetical protein [Jannaschia sp. CCS1]